MFLTIVTYIGHTKKHLWSVPINEKSKFILFFVIWIRAPIDLLEVTCHNRCCPISHLVQGNVTSIFICATNFTVNLYTSTVGYQTLMICSLKEPHLLKYTNGNLTWYISSKELNAVILWSGVVCQQFSVTFSVPIESVFWN